MKNREQLAVAAAAAVIFALAATIAYFLIRPAAPAAVTIASIPPTSTPILTPSRTPVPRDANTFPLTITDGVGRVVQIKQLPQRLVVVGIGLLDMCNALGVYGQVVGVDNGNDAAASMARVGDERQPDADKIAALNPNLVLITDSPKAREVADTLIAKNIPALLFNPRTVEDVISTVGTVGQAVGSNAAAVTVQQAMTAQLEALVGKRGSDKPPIVFYEVDASNLRQPLTITPDSFIGSLIAEAGGQVYVPLPPSPTTSPIIDDLSTDTLPPIATDTPNDEPSDAQSGENGNQASDVQPTAEVAATPDNSDNPIDLIPTATPIAGPIVAVPLDRLKQQPPDIIILGDTSLGITIAEAKQRPGWADIATIKAGRVYGIDPRLLRPGPRCIEGLAQLARIIKENG